MKKSIVSHLATFILGGIIFGSVGATLAYSYVASDISYTTSHNSSVENVEQAINDLYDKAEKNYIDPIGKIVYFDPVNNTSCDTYTSSNSLNQTKTGCLKWYVIKDNGSSIDVLLDHNTTYTQAWYSSNTNVAYASSLVKPQVDALVTTTGWKVTPRLITAEEIKSITGNTNFDLSTAGWYCLGSNKQDYSSSPYCNSATNNNFAWLFDYTINCEQKGCNTQDNSSGTGYWTSTTVGTAGSGSLVWYVRYYGILGNSNASTTDRGVRPVVSISKSQL